MNAEHKKFIEENMSKKSVKEMAGELGIKEKSVRRYIEARSTAAEEKAAPQAPAAPERAKPFVVALILAAVFLVYANVLKGPFIFDDEVLVRDNTMISHIADIPKLFKADLFMGDFKSGPVSNSYRPLQMTTYAIDRSVWKENTTGYHLTNILLHMLNTLLVFLLVRAAYPGVYAAYLVALVFGVHPVNTACVSYISGRADIMGSIFILSSVIGRRYFDKTGAKAFLAVSAVSYLLAIYSKEYAILTVPLLVVATDIFFGKFPARLWSYAVYALPLALYLPMRLSALKGLTSLRLELSYMEPVTRILTTLKTLFIDIRILLLPYDMHFGRTTKIEKGLLYSPESLLTVIALISIAAAFVFFFRRYRARPTSGARAVLYGTAWFFLAMVPLMNIFPLQAFLADNWLYLSSVGIYLAAAVPVDGLLRVSVRSHFAYRAAILTVLAAVISCYAYGTVARNRDYLDPVKFYLSNAERRPTVKFYGAVAELYSRNKDYENAAKYARVAVRVNEIYPSKDVYKAYYNLGWAALKLGNYGESEKAFLEVVSSDEVGLKDSASKALEFVRRKLNEQAK